MRFMHEHGHEIHVCVLTSGASGVEDGWQGMRSEEEKTCLREAEQRASCAYFGLPPDRLSFLRLWERGEDASDEKRLREHLLSLRPELVFLPHGNDSNRTHRRTYESFRAIALKEGLQLWACLNLDAKTLSMRPDLYMFFGEQDALWKGRLLRMHRSQHERNLNSRNIGFDERILNVNRDAARKAGSALPYAEVFELERYV